MRAEALFINGVFEEVLREILKVQSVVPEQILFLQPYAGSAIAKLRDEPPTTESPMRLFLSTTDSLATVSYEAEIVGWDDKRTLTDKKRQVLNRIIYCLQPDEGGLYDASRAGEGKSVNLLHVRRLHKLNPPSSVDHLVKTGDSEPLSTGRTTAGGWAYVRNCVA